MQAAAITLRRWLAPLAWLAIPALLVGSPGITAASPAQQCSAALGQMPASGGEPLDNEFDFLSWNIQKAANAGWQEDLASFGEGIALAFIQEASLQAPIAGTIPTPLYQAFAAGYHTGTESTGVMTLSTSSPSLHCNLTAWEPWLGTPKATSITEYPMRGRVERLLAINLHAVNFAVGLEEFEEQIHALTDLLVAHQGPVIFAGDLNTWSEGRQLLVDSFARSFGLSPVQFLPDQRTTMFGRALDHIYIRGLLADSARAIPVSSSDHNPLRVRLRLP